MFPLYNSGCFNVNMIFPLSISGECKEYMMRVTRTPTWFNNDDLIIMMIIPIKIIYFDYFYYCIVFNYYHYTVDYIIIVILSIL